MGRRLRGRSAMRLSDWLWQFEQTGPRSLPIVLLADGQTVGGYPKIATVIGADLGRLAQARPGTEIAFRAVSHGEAVRALAEQRAFLDAPIAIEPLRRDRFSSEFLLGRNLVGGWIDARRPG